MSNVLPNGDAEIEQLDAVEATNACDAVRPWTGQIHCNGSVPGVAKEGSTKETA